MTKAQLDRMWYKCVEKGKEADEERRECAKRGAITPRYISLAKDAAKLKLEYEKAKAQGISDPLSVKHNTIFMRQKVVGDIMGRSGPDTHHSILGTKERKYR